MMMRALVVVGVLTALLVACGHDAAEAPPPSSVAAPPPTATAGTATTTAPAPPPSPADLEADATLTVADVPVTLLQHEEGSAAATCARPDQVDAGQANVLTFPVRPEHVSITWLADHADEPEVLWDGGAEAGPFELPVGTGRLDVHVAGATFENAYTACLTVRALS